MDFIKRMILWVLSIPGVAFFMVCTLISTVLGNKNSTAKCGNWMRGQWYLFIEEPTAVLHWLSGWRSGLMSRFSDWKAARAEKKEAKLKAKAEAAKAAKLKADKAKKEKAEAKEAKGSLYRRFLRHSLNQVRDILVEVVKEGFEDFEEVGVRTQGGVFIPEQPGQMPEAESSDLADGADGGDCDEEFLIETESVDPLGDTDEALAVVTVEDEVPAVEKPMSSWMPEVPLHLGPRRRVLEEKLEQAAQVSEFRLAGMSLTWQEQLKLWASVCVDRDKGDRSKLAVQEALTNAVEEWTGDESAHQEFIRGHLVASGARPDFP